MPLKIDSSTFFFGTKIFSFLKTENKKKPNATIENLNARAAKGSLWSTIGFVVIKAEDQSITNINGNNLII